MKGINLKHDSSHPNRHTNKTIMDGKEMSNRLLDLHILPTVLVALIVPYLFIFFVPSKIREWKRTAKERKRLDEERKRLEELVHRRPSVDDDDNVVEVSAIYIYPGRYHRLILVSFI